MEHLLPESKRQGERSGLGKHVNGLRGNDSKISMAQKLIII